VHHINPAGRKSKEGGFRNGADRGSTNKMRGFFAALRMTIHFCLQQFRKVYKVLGSAWAGPGKENDLRWDVFEIV
jgi:hypothetical protein